MRFDDDDLRRIREVVREELAAARLAAPATSEPRGDGPVYLTARQAADMVGTGAASIRRWVSKGELRGCFAGRHLRIERGDLDRYLRTRAKPGAAPEEVALRIISGPEKRRP